MDLDNKKSNEIEQQNPYFDSFFSAGGAFLFMVKKTEKLASAVYLVTNFFPDNDPIRRELRDKVSSALSFILSYKKTGNSVFFEFLRELEFRIFEVLSLLEVSLNAGFISKMNLMIIKQEFINLLDVVSSQKDSKEVSRVVFPKSFFDVGSGIDQSILRKNLPVEEESILTQKLSKGVESVESNQGFKKNSRQNIILSLIKRKKEVTIKDISFVIKNCSEKTIQRELITFISAGIIKRTGERRWSKYSLV